MPHYQSAEKLIPAFSIVMDFHFKLDMFQIQTFKHTSTREVNSLVMPIYKLFLSIFFFNEHNSAVPSKSGHGI